MSEHRGAGAPLTYAAGGHAITSPGIGRFGLIGTVSGVSGIMLAFLFAQVAGLGPGLVVLILTIAGLLPLIYSREGRNGYAVLTAWLGFTWASRSGSNTYTPALLPSSTGLGIAGPTPVPGLLARSQLRSLNVALYGPVGLLRTRANRWSVMLSCSVDGGQLIDPGMLNLWVSNWGAWLGSLPHEPQIVAATVTVEAAPETGTALVNECQRMRSPKAPPLAAAFLDEVASRWPSACSAIRTWVTLTWSTARPGQSPASAEQMETLIAGRIPFLCGSLAATGAGAVTPMTAEQVVARARIAYDPAAAPLFDELQAQGVDHGLTWAEAGPMSLREYRDHLVHDSGVSVTYRMTSSPISLTVAQVLAPLLNAHPDLLRKRVTLIFRHHGAAEAARVADSDLRTAANRAGERRGEMRATAAAALLDARQAAAEQAAGAGLTRISALVTVTAADLGALPAAKAVVEQLAQRAQLQIRVATNTQSAAFTCALGLGVLPTDVTFIPSVVRENL